MPNGKLNRLLLAPPTDCPRTDRPFTAPRTPLEEFLAELWRDLLHVEPIGVEDDFFELGGNSLQGAVLMNRLQEKLGQHVYTVALFDSPTIAGLAGHLGEVCPETISRLFGPASLRENPESRIRNPQEILVLLQPHGSRPPFFMVHPPGGIVVCYQPLARHLGREQPFYGIRSRGLHGEQDLPTRLEDMAAEYVAGIRRVQPAGPYHLGGWSMGGIVALEMAQQILAQGQQVGLLAFLDTTIPAGPANGSYAEESIRSGQEYGLDLTLDELRQLSPDEQLPYLWQHAQKLGVIEMDTPLSLVRQVLDDLKRLFHLHVQLASDYAVRPYPGRITLFRPTDAPVAVPTSPDRGWTRLAAVDVHFVPGQHHSMVKEPHVQGLAEQLRTSLRQADASGAGAPVRK